MEEYLRRLTKEELEQAVLKVLSDGNPRNIRHILTQVRINLPNILCIYIPDINQTCWSLYHNGKLYFSAGYGFCINPLD